MKYIPYNMAVFKMLYVGALFMWFFNWLSLVVLRVLQALRFCHNFKTTAGQT